MFKNTEKEKWISFSCIAALFLVVLPLLILGHYNYPSADDWSLGLLTHQAVLEGKGFFGVLKAALQTSYDWTHGSEPRFANAFLGSLQPGIWGEHFYRFTPYLMIGSLIFSEFLLAYRLLCKNHKKNRIWLCPVLVPSLILQFLCVPYPTETFYWYVGAVNYTFIFSLSLILVYLFFRLAEETAIKKIILFEILGILSAIPVSGANYSANLSALCFFGSFSLFYLFKNKKAFFRTLPITLVISAGLLLCLISPGNQMRLNRAFEGSTNGILQSIWMSLTRTCVNIYSWTTPKIWIMIILIVPFLDAALKNTDYTFKKPALFTLFTFGIYASQITANMYVEAGISACRVADILYYGYHVWLLLNVGYWTGWFQHKKFFSKFREKFPSRTIWFIVFSLLLILITAATDLKTSSTYRACAWLLKGKAAAYANVWEERLVLLHDDSIKELKFEPWPGGADMIFYADFDPDNSWFGEVCAAYYDKDSIQPVIMGVK